jgi:hypothetical protein
MNIPFTIDDNIISKMGKKDQIVEKNSKWILYKLDILDKKGLWLKFKNKLNNLKETDKLESINGDEIESFYYQNADIEFEVLFYEDFMQKHNLFKINNQIYSYSIGKNNKRLKRKAYVRFYFDLNEFFNY